MVSRHNGIVIFGVRISIAPLMDKNLIKMATMWEDSGMPAVLKMAPKGAVQFDRMLVVFSDESMRIIRKVFFYDSKRDKFTAEY